MRRTQSPILPEIKTEVRFPQGYNVGELEIPDQAYEIGPPPMLGSSRGRSSAPEGQDKMRGNSTGHLLAYLEKQTGPTVGPVYHVLPPPPRLPSSEAHSYIAHPLPQ